MENPDTYSSLGSWGQSPLEGYVVYVIVDRGQAPGNRSGKPIIKRVSSRSICI